MGRARLPVVLLPGLDGSGRLFDPLLAALAARPSRLAPRVLALPHDAPRAYDEYLAVVQEALPRRGAFALLAESFSGPLAVRAAAGRPAGLTGLVLAATFLRRPLAPWLAPLSPLVGAPLFSLPLLPPAVRWLLAGADAPDELVSAIRAAVADVPAAVLARRAREALAVDVRAALARTEVPLLLLSARRDRLLRPGMAEELLEARPDAQTETVDGPHTILQARPAACLERLVPFLEALA